MPGRAEPCDQHDVESQRQLGQVGPRQQKGRRGAGDAAALARQHGGGGAGEVAAGLDLDDREDAPAPGEDVDFARWTAPVGGDDSPAAQPQMPAAQKFGELSATPGATPGPILA
jgi:hypothetical protein